ncbi:MAG: hypothetical protein ACXU8O_05215, partial [Asticcacaulis sp.]
EANIIFGAAFDPSLEGKLRVSVVATGMDGVALQTPVAPPARAAVTPPTFGLGYSSRPETQPRAPEPAPHVPLSAVMPQVTTHIEPRPAPSITPPRPTSSLFEDRPPQIVTPQPQPAPQPPSMYRPVAQEAAPPPEPEPEPYIPSVTVETVAEAPAPEPQVEPAPVQQAQPVITRPGAYRPAPQQPQAQPQPQPRATEEEGRESFWRGLFPQRQRSEAAFNPIGSAQTVQPQQDEDEGDRYTPGSSRTALNSAVKPDQQPAGEAEDDLEIPSFLRRLAN